MARQALRTTRQAAHGAVNGAVSDRAVLDASENPAGHAAGDLADDVSDDLSGDARGDLSADTPAGTPADASGPPASPTLRAFDIVAALARSEAPPSLDDLTRASGLPRPTVHRMLSLLAGAGLALRDPVARGWTAGPRLYALAADLQRTSRHRAQRVAVLRGLVDEIGETCNYTMLDGDAVLYVERVETSSPLRLHMEPGCRVPLHCTASGKLFLSQMSAQDARRLLGRAPYRRYTQRTMCDFATLSREIDRIRASGIGTDVGEYLEGSVCLAVPVLDARGRPCAALAVHGPAPRYSLRKAHEHVPALRRAARALAAIATRQTTHEETRP